MTTGSCKPVRVWDAPTRIFHWLNVLTVVLLIFTGLAFTLRGLLDLAGPDAALAYEIAIIKLHSVVGYVFAINLAFRLLWAFVGNAHARWCAFLPTAASLKELPAYLGSLVQGRVRHYLGHNPAGRLAITTLLALLLVLAITGVIRASTDLYYPPFGNSYAKYMVRPGGDLAALKAGDWSQVSQAKWSDIRSRVFLLGTIHRYASYLLMLVAALHIIAVVVTERREAGLVSAMISGNKLLPEEDGR